MEGSKMKYYVMIDDLAGDTKFINHAIRYDEEWNKSFWIWNGDTIREYDGMHFVDCKGTGREYMQISKATYDYVVEMLMVEGSPL